MSDRDTDPGHGVAAAEAFGILGNETRTDILRALIEREDEAPLSFSDLRESVGAPDSGKFNYHLQQLVGHFVEHGEDGYDFRFAGRRIAHAILAGTFTERAEMDPIEAPGTCHECGAEALLAGYEDERLRIWCDECDDLLLTVPFSPAAVRNRSSEGVLAAFDRWSTTQAMLAADGICPECTGEMEGSITTRAGEELDFEVLPRFVCTVCQRSVVTSFGSVAIQHPEVMAFHHRHDAYPRQRPYWTVEQLVTPHHTEVLSEDPWRIRVAFPIDGEDARVEATVDGDATVVDVTTHE